MIIRPNFFCFSKLHVVEKDTSRHQGFNRAKSGTLQALVLLDCHFKSCCRDALPFIFHAYDYRHYQHRMITIVRPSKYLSKLSHEWSLVVAIFGESNVMIPATHLTIGHFHLQFTVRFLVVVRNTYIETQRNFVSYPSNSQKWIFKSILTHYISELIR